VKTYLLRVSDREECPFSEEQVAQLFADGAVNRDTSCKLAGGSGEWKTIDDFMPMLKYGTQLPAPTSPVVRTEAPPVYGWKSSPPPPPLPKGRVPADARVSVVDFDLPFGSILKLMFKWVAAWLLVSICFIPVVMLLVFVLMAIFGTLLGGLLSGFHHP
jgi:hypothetical protein